MADASPIAQADPKTLAKAKKKMGKVAEKFGRGPLLGMLGKEKPAPESNAGISAPGMYDVKPQKRMSDPEVSAKLGGARMRNVLQEVPRYPTDDNLLPVEN
jgi:hypothetical protein